MNDRFDFDALAQDVARGLSRREALRRLGMGLAAGLFAELTGWLPAWPTARAEAASVAPSSTLCFPEIVTKGSLTSWLTVASTLELATLKSSLCTGCTAEACCNNVCVGLESDPKNCGACGRTCGLGQSCENGICVCVSDAACVIPGPNGRGMLLLTCCHGTCTDFQTDPSNCGSCGHVCAAGLTCSGGKCGQLTTCPRPGLHPCGLVCCESTQMCCPGRVNAPCCEPGLICCGSVCADLSSDSSNCGTCGHICSQGLQCSNGVCCAPGQTGCGSGCRNLANDVNNCGACGHQCFARESCVNGQCKCGVGPGCSSDQICCSGQCCNEGQVCCNGQCCAVGQVCSNGKCCPSGTTNCSGTCVNLQTDVNNCSACGHACPAATNAKAVCNAGVCGSVCIPPFANCFGTGCTTNTSHDSGNCGACFNSCNGLTQICCGSQCIDGAFDNDNCGSCGNKCGSIGPARCACVAAICTC